ncbi:DUF982 domain-containing protein [Mesorhizobium sp. B2-4-17]|uniref:DUF982 domain-containing protein n=1 Tax=Mesorhizobium sp. B2-4-17 TaxID=2589932 RepID=UPI001128D778|nr:DUF982 domain-containing protein [Mesorhizobium sp. B2-4-17]TPK78200.1 DUF982 domain-containing protein [Mesorhizobium sp. B2-4-17]
MALHWFAPPVYIKALQPGATSGISHVEGASQELLRFTKKGPHWNKAIRVCMAALAEQATPQEVRRCFRLAAKEEGILRENA